MTKRQYRKCDIAFSLPRNLFHLPQHILNKYSVADRRIIYHNVRDLTDKLAVLNDGRTAHECGQEGTTHFYKLLTISTLLVKKIVLCDSILAYILTQTNTSKLFYLIF